MKNQTNKQRLLSILFCSLSTVIFGFGSWIDRTQGETPTKKLPQQGFGRAPNPNPTVTPTSTEKPSQQGFGRAPNPNPTVTPTSTEKPSQQGFGRAPNPNPSDFQIYKTQ